MSIQPANLPARAGRGEPATRAARMPTGDSLARIREQAADIIQEVLSGTDPDQAQARKALLRQCAAHPGHPEIALAEHLLTIRGITVLTSPGRNPRFLTKPHSAGAELGQRGER